MEALNFAATDTRLLLPVKDAAKALGIGITSAWRLIGQGDLQTRKIGARTLVTAESIRQVAENGAQ